MAGARNRGSTYGLAYSGRGNAGGGYVLLWTWETAPKANGGIYFYAKEDLVNAGFIQSGATGFRLSLWQSFISQPACCFSFIFSAAGKQGYAVLIGQSLFTWCVAAVLLKGTEYAAKVNLMVG